jgi:hypothetical protein
MANYTISHCSPEGAMTYKTVDLATAMKDLGGHRGRT